MPPSAFSLTYSRSTKTALLNSMGIGSKIVHLWTLLKKSGMIPVSLQNPILKEISLETSSTETTNQDWHKDKIKKGQSQAGFSRNRNQISHYQKLGGTKQSSF
jgi:hypothetical protein